MSSKISIVKILTDHKKTLVDQNTEKPGGEDLFYFLILPVIVPILLIWLFGFDFEESSDLKKTLVSSLAIFVGLLFNALVLLINIAKNEESKNVKHVVIKELIANISFSIIIAFISVILILTRYWQIPMIFEVDLLPTTGQIIDFFALCFLTSFFFTFLMIIKRTYLIININFEKEKNTTDKNG